MNTTDSILELAIGKGTTDRLVRISHSEHTGDDEKDAEHVVSLGAFGLDERNEPDLCDREVPYVEAKRNWLAPVEGDHVLQLAIQEYDKDMRDFRLFIALINVLGLFMISIITFICVKWLDGFSLHPDRASLADYNVHLVLTIVGFVLATAYAMLIFRIFPNVNISRLIACHIISLMLMTFIATFGVKIAFDSHHVYGRYHLYSLHSWVGVTIVALFLFLLISGTWLYYSEQNLPYMKYLHRNAGVILFALSVAASISGLLTRSRHTVTNVSRGTPIPIRAIILNTLGLTLTIFSVLVRHLLCEFRFRRRPRPGSEEEKIQQGYGAATTKGYVVKHRRSSDYKERLRTSIVHGYHGSYQELHKVSSSHPSSGDRKSRSDSGIFRKSRPKSHSLRNTGKVELADGIFDVPNL